MKKISMMVLAAFVLAGAPHAFAESSAATSFSSGAEKGSVQQSRVPETPIWKNRDFWQKEKERSGLPEFWQGTKNFFSRLNPIPSLREQRQRYEQRRTADTGVNADSRATQNVSTRPVTDTDSAYLK